MLELSSFRDATARVVALAVEHEGALRESLLGPLPNNASSSSNDEWRYALSAYRLLWEVASREGAKEVVADLRRALPDVPEEGLYALESLLEADEITQQRVRGVRRRDQFLPILTDARFTVDVRLVPDGDDDVLLAPVIVVRLEFDEPLFGADGVVFQVPLTQMSVLEDALARVRRQLSDLTKTLQHSEVPDWALEGYHP
jgi:hypothetical protein